MKICPYCGNPHAKVQESVDNEGAKGANFCSVCNKEFPLDKQQKKDSGINDHPFIILHDGPGLWEEIERKDLETIARYGSEFVDYAKKHKVTNVYANAPYLISLFNDEEAIDISEENIQKCQQLYKKAPDDYNNLLRLLLVNIFADRDCKDLIQKFIELWKGKNISVTFYFNLIWELEESSKPYIPKLREFLFLLLETDPVRFKEELNEEYNFQYLSKVIGITALSQLIDPQEILWSNFNFRWDDEYLKYYALAKFYFSEKRWLDAYCLFIKLYCYNGSFKVTNEELLSFENDLDCYGDILYSAPTVEDIEASADESFSKIEFSNKNEQDNLSSLIARFYLRYWRKNDVIEEKDHELTNYLKVYTMLVSIFNCVLQGNYSEAFNEWIGWDKTGVKMMGIDVWEVTRNLKNLRDEVGNQSENLANLFSKNELVTYFGMISDMENKLREFIVESLKGYYGNEDLAWNKGVSQKIRIDCRIKQEQKSDPKTSQWAFLDFPDYLEIITTADNWRQIFKNQFIIEKKDAQKNASELTEFLRKLIHLRNTIVHSHRPLEESEKCEIQTAANLFNQIYSNWKAKKR